MYENSNNNQLCILYKSSKKYASCVAIQEMQRTITYQDLYLLSVKFEQYIQNNFYKKQYCLILAIPTIEYIACIFALIRLRIIYLPISIKETIQIREKYLSELENSFFLDPSSIDHNTFNSAIDSSYTPIIDPTIPANIMLTSGSSGTPKKVVHCMNAHIKNALGGQSVMEIQCRDKYLLSLPLNHVGGQAIIFKSIIFGACIVINDLKTKDLSIVIKDYHVNHLSLVPTQAHRLIQSHNYQKDLNSIKSIILGGAPITQALINQIKTSLPNVKLYGSYGSTEMASQICTNEISTNITAGYPLPYRELMISEVNNEILVKGDTLALGYLIDNHIIKITDDKGWFHTKDIGYISNKGLIIKGRIDNIFICGGENLSPEQIEKEILNNSSISNVVIVAIPNEEWGHIACALVDEKSYMNLDKIKLDLANKINHLYLPKIWLPLPQEFLQTFKINRTKVTKYALATLGIVKT